MARRRSRFTAHDVDFTFNRIIYNDDIRPAAVPRSNSAILDEATGAWRDELPMTVTALDDYTVQCVLPVPFAPFLRSMGTAIYPKHILEPHVDDGHVHGDVWDIDTDPSEVIGTGPFTIASYIPGERVAAAQPRLLAQGRRRQQPAVPGSRSSTRS